MHNIQVCVFKMSIVKSVHYGSCISLRDRPYVLSSVLATPAWDGYIYMRSHVLHAPCSLYLYTKRKFSVYSTLFPSFLNSEHFKRVLSNLLTHEPYHFVKMSLGKETWCWNMATNLCHNSKHWKNALSSHLCYYKMHYILFVFVLSWYSGYCWQFCLLNT